LVLPEEIELVLLQETPELGLVLDLKGRRSEAEPSALDRVDSQEKIVLALAQVRSLALAKVHSLALARVA
jgi:hypothetical protein